MKLATQQAHAGRHESDGKLNAGSVMLWPLYLHGFVVKTAFGNAASSSAVQYFGKRLCGRTLPIPGSWGPGTNTSRLVSYMQQHECFNLRDPYLGTYRKHVSNELLEVSNSSVCTCSMSSISLAKGLRSCKTAYPLFIVNTHHMALL